MKYLMISRDTCGNYNLTAEIDGVRFPRHKYIYYSLRDAIKEYRKTYNLKGRHLQKIECGVHWY